MENSTNLSIQKSVNKFLNSNGYILLKGPDFGINTHITTDQNAFAEVNEAEVILVQISFHF